MENPFEEFKQKIKGRNKWSWRYLSEEENTIIITRDDGQFFNRIDYSKELTEKMKHHFPNGKLVIRNEILDRNKQLLREDFGFIVDHDNKTLEVRVSVKYEGKVTFSDEGTSTLDEYWQWNEEYADKESKKMIDFFKKEIVNSNQYRLHFLFQ